MASTHLYCTACGAANQTQDTYCFSCGRLLRSTTPLMQYPTVVSASNTLTGLLTLNHLLKQRYRILEQLGKGGFGAVYKAEDTQFGNRLVAVKEMGQRELKTQQEITEATDAFKREALMLAGLRHQNLPRIYDHFSDGGRWYLVMDYIEGETVGDHLDKVGGHPPVEEVLQIGIQLCTVLDYLHTRQPPIIFRDLTPNNIMLTPDGHLYLIDFGIARLFKPGQAKDTTAFGTLGYAAPELLSKQTTPRSDIYSLGAILHQMLTGMDPSQKPFRFAPPQLSGNPALIGLSTLVMQMLDMDEVRRPANMTTIKQELQQIAAQLTGKIPLPLTQPAGGTFPSATLPGGNTFPPSTTQRTQGRNRKVGIAAVTIAVLVILAFLIPTLLKNTGQSSSQPSSNNSSNALTPAPTATTIPTPSPTPTPASVVGKVLYETHDFSGWTGTSDWKLLSDTNTLVNDATRDHSQPPYGPSIPAPYLVQGTNNYAVEAMIQVSNTNVHSYYPCFGITIRGNPVGDSWQGYYVGVGCNSYLSSVFMSNVNTIDSYLKEAQFDPRMSWHTYRVEVKGNDIKFLIDGGLILELTDNTYLTGNQVGLFCYSVQLSVRDFKVIGL